MTNNFSTIKNKVRSEKIILVRMNPARQVIDDLTVVSGFSYDMTFNFPVSGIKVDGVALSRNDLTALSAGEFSHNEDTGILTVKLAAAIGTYTAVIVYYYLFYTNSINRQATQDPEDSTTTLRNWEGRISGFPEFETTQEDIIDSVLTIGNTSLNIINDDADFQKYLTDNDSFSRKEVKIWQCLNKVANIQKFFFGFASSITVSNTVVISVDNAFSALDDNFYPNGTHIKSIFNATDYPNIAEEYKEKYIPKIYSLCSKTKDVSFVKKYPVFFGVSGELQNYFIPVDGFRLVNISYSLIVNKTNNRTWAACIASNASSDYVDTLSGVVEIFGTPNFVYEISVDNAYKFRSGDNILIDKGAGYLDGFYVWGIFTATNKIWVTGPSSILNGHILKRPAIPVVTLAIDNYLINFRYGRDFTYTTDANGVYNIVFEDNFENNFAGYTIDFLDGLQPDAVLYFRVYNHDDLRHGTIVQEMIEAIGLTVNSSSITQANVTETNVNFSVPYIGDTTVLTVRGYLQDLLASTFAHLSLTNDFEIAYNLIETISASEEINEYDFLQGTLSQEISYRDVISSLKFENIHGELTFTYVTYLSFPETKVTYDFRSEDTIEIDEATYLHDVKKGKTIKYIVQEMGAASTSIKNILSNRRAKYFLVTKGKNFSSTIGDEFILISNKIIGIAGQKNIKIFSINRSAEATKLKGLDLLGL